MRYPERWDRSRYAVERQCDCAKKTHECKPGWHRVDGSNDEQRARETAAECIAKHTPSHGMDYRVTDSETGAVLR